MGGYVKMLGEEGEEKEVDKAGSFQGKSVWFRSAIVVAGVVMNFLLSIIFGI